MILESLLANNIFSSWPIFRIAWVRRIEGHMVTSRPSHHYTIHSPHHAATTPSMASTSSPSSSLSVQVQLSKSSQVVHGGAYFSDVSSWKSIPLPIEIGVWVEEFASFVRMDLLQSRQLWQILVVSKTGNPSTNTPISMGNNLLTAGWI